MGHCQIPNGCIHDEAANACPLCDEHGADDIAAYWDGLNSRTAVAEAAPHVEAKVVRDVTAQEPHVRLTER